MPMSAPEKIMTTMDGTSVNNEDDDGGRSDSVGDNDDDEGEVGENR